MLEPGCSLGVAVTECNWTTSLVNKALLDLALSGGASLVCRQVGLELIAPDLTAAHRTSDLSISSHFIICQLRGT